MKRSKKFRALCLLMSLSVISGMVASCSLPTTTTKQADVTAKHDTRGDDYVEPDTPDVTEEPTIITTEESEKPLSDSDFEIKEYSYTNILDDSMYFLIIKNNSSQRQLASMEISSFMTRRTKNLVLTAVRLMCLVQVTNQSWNSILMM